MRTSLQKLVVLILLCLFTANLNLFGQHDIGIRYLQDYLSLQQPAAGVLFSYDSITAETSLATAMTGEGFMTAMMSSANKEKADRKAFAYYESLTTIALSKIRNLGNIKYSDHNDKVIEGGVDRDALSDIMSSNGLDLLFHVVIDPVFYTHTEDMGAKTNTSVFLNIDIDCQVYIQGVGNFSMPLYYISYNLTAEEKRRQELQSGMGSAPQGSVMASQQAAQQDKPTINEIQEQIAEERIGAYSRSLLALKELLESNTRPEPVAIIRSVVDEKRVIVESSVNTLGQGGFVKTLTDVNEAVEGTDKEPVFGVYPMAYNLSEGLVVATVEGDNPSTSQTETSYEVAVAQLIVREGSIEAATSRVKALAKPLTFEDIVGMAVIPKTEATLYLTNPRLVRDVSSMSIRKTPYDEGFLAVKREAPAAVQKTSIKSTTKDAFSQIGQAFQGPTKMVGGVSVPLEDYRGNEKVFPPTQVESSSFNFEGKVKEMTTAIKELENQGYKIGVVFSPLLQFYTRYGVVDLFSEEEVKTMIRNGDKTYDRYNKDAPSPTLVSQGGLGMNAATNERELPANERLTLLGLANPDFRALKSSGPEAASFECGENIVQALNEAYATDVFELVDCTKLPEMKKGYDLPKTQYKVLGTYSLIISDNSINSSLKYVYVNKKGKAKLFANKMMAASYKGSIDDGIDAFLEHENEQLSKFVKKMK